MDNTQNKLISFLLFALILSAEYVLILIFWFYINVSDCSIFVYFILLLKKVSHISSIDKLLENFLSLALVVFYSINFTIIECFYIHAYRHHKSTLITTSFRIALYVYSALFSAIEFIQNLFVIRTSTYYQAEVAAFVVFIALDSAINIYLKDFN